MSSHIQEVFRISCEALFSWLLSLLQTLHYQGTIRSPVGV